MTEFPVKMAIFLILLRTALRHKSWGSKCSLFD